MAKKRGAEGPCPICATCSPLTDEDAIPQWLRKIEIGLYPDGWYPEPKTIIRICRACNSGLGRYVENPAAPILKRMMDGSGVKLDLQMQTAVAKWCIKTSLTLAMKRQAVPGYPIDPKHANTMSRWFAQELRVLANGGGIEPRWTVRMGLLRDDAKGASDLRPFLGMPVPDPNEYAYRSVMPAGRLLIEASSTELRLRRELLRNTSTDRRLSRFWPLKTNILIWPPPVQLSYEDDRRLTSEWGINPDHSVGERPVFLKFDPDTPPASSIG